MSCLLWQVTCEGQIIGAIVADTQTHAQRAANEVVVQYSDLKPIITIEVSFPLRQAIGSTILFSIFSMIHCVSQEAIKAESLYTQNRQIMVKGDVEVGFQSCDHIVEGEVQMGSQEQFYLETQASLVIPKEDGEIEVISSSQSPSEGQVRNVLECVELSGKINNNNKKFRCMLLTSWQYQGTE